MRLTLHQLRVFQVVAEKRSVTLAAQQLHMTQPAVSNILRQLQAYYGCELIEVIGRKLSLTHFGEALLTYCNLIEKTLSDAKSEVEMLKGGISGTITVTSVTTAKYFVPQLLGRFKQEHPKVHVKYTVCNRRETIDRLEANLDDFVIMSHPPTAMPIDYARFFDDEIVVVAPPKHELIKKKTLRLKDLATAPWIIREEGSGTRYATEKIFKKHRFSANVEMEIGDNEGIKQAVMANMGISAISKRSVEMEVKDKLLCILPLKEFPVNHPWYLVINKGKALSPIAKKFYTFVNNHYPRFIRQ